MTSHGRRAISGAGDGDLFIWDIATGSILQTLPRHINLVQSVAISPNDELAVSGSEDSTAIVWDLKDGKPLHRLKHTWTIRAVAFAPDGKEVLTGCNDNIIRLFNAQTGTLIKTYVGHGASIETVAFSPEGRWIISASADNSMRLWNRETGQLKSIFNHSTPVFCGVIA